MTPAGAIIERARILGRSGNVREAARLLRDLLAEDQNNTEIRRTLAQIYRDAGHPDQAGRYEFGMPYAIAAEQDLFLRHLVAIGADEAQLRRPNMLPDNVTIPDDIATRLARLRRVHEGTAAWDSVAAVGALVFALISILTVLAVYVIVLVGGEFAVPVARLGGVASLAPLIILTVGVGMSSWMDGSRKVVIGWTITTAILTVAFVLAAIAIFGSRG